MFILGFGPGNMMNSLLSNPGIMNMVRYFYLV